MGESGEGFELMALESHRDLIRETWHYLVASSTLI